MTQPAAAFLPVPNATKPFWLSLEDSDPFSSFQSSPQVPKRTDILVIGSGYAGTAVVYNLLKNSPGLDVTVLEARTLCSGATGRNGGHIKPYYHRLYSDYEKDHGQYVAAQVVNSEVQHIYALKSLIEEEDIACDFVLTRACDVYMDHAKADADIASYKKLLANPYVKDEVKSSIQVVSGKDAEILTKVVGAKVCFSYPAGHVWPWKLMISILKKCVDKGLKLYANTPVTNVSRDSETGDYIVQTPHGVTIAKKVVYCTNAYTKSILHPFKDAIIPAKESTTYIRPAHSETKAIPQLPNTYGIFSSASINSNYLINRADGGVVVGGRSDLSIKPDGDYSELYDNVDDSYVPQPVYDHLQGFMKKTFSTWKDFDAKNVYTWCGIIGYTKDKFPYVGELDFLNLKNSYIIAGFDGHGMPRVYLSAKSLAESILTGKPIREVGGIPECYYVNAKRLDQETHDYKDEMEEVVEALASRKVTSSKL